MQFCDSVSSGRFVVLIVSQLGSASVWYASLFFAVFALFIYLVLFSDVWGGALLMFLRVIGVLVFRFLHRCLRTSRLCVSAIICLLSCPDQSIRLPPGPLLFILLLTWMLVGVQSAFANGWICPPFFLAVLCTLRQVCLVSASSVSDFAFVCCFLVCFLICSFSVGVDERR
jgi:hypothetical protein